MSNSPTTTTRPAFKADTNSYPATDIDAFDTLDIDGPGISFTAFQTVKPHASLGLHRVETIRAQEVHGSICTSITINVRNEDNVTTAVTLYGVTRDQLVAALADARIIG